MSDVTLFGGRLPPGLIFPKYVVVRMFFMVLITSMCFQRAAILCVYDRAQDLTLWKDRLEHALWLRTRSARVTCTVA